jgi:hypothetical protein
MSRTVAFDAGVDAGSLDLRIVHCDDSATFCDVDFAQFGVVWGHCQEFGGDGFVEGERVGFARRCGEFDVEFDGGFAHCRSDS